MIYNMLFQFFLVYDLLVYLTMLLFRYGMFYLSFMDAKICICFEMRNSLWRFDYIKFLINRTNPSIRFIPLFPSLRHHRLGEDSRKPFRVR